MIVTREQYDALRISGKLEESRQSRKQKRCGVKVGDVREIKWRDEKGDRPRGGMMVTAAHIERVTEDKSWRWNILWTTGPIEQPDYMLARGIGYTRDSSASCDPEAAAPYSPDIERIVNDGLAAKREARRLKLAKLKEDAGELAEDPEVKRHHDRIIRAIQDALEDVA